MKTLLVEGPGICLSVTLDSVSTGQSLLEVVSARSGIPTELLTMSHCGKRVPASQDVSELTLDACPVLRVSLSLPGGMIEPSLRKLALMSVACLVCRKCYCRNGMDRTTCRKCGWTDLRQKKRHNRDMKRVYDSIRHSH